MTKIEKWVVCTVTVILLILFAFAHTPTGVAVLNGYGFQLQKADDATNYKTIKKVEDTCRAMQASYHADRLVYEQYKDGDEEEQDWAKQAKVRANRTASNYNNYILENSFIWAGNVPSDIQMELPYLE